MTTLSYIIFNDTKLSNINVSFRKKEPDIEVSIKGETYKVYEIESSLKSKCVCIEVGLSDFDKDQKTHRFHFLIRNPKNLHFSLKEFFASLETGSLCKYEMYDIGWYRNYTTCLKNSKLKIFEYTDNGAQFNDCYYNNMYNTMFDNLTPERLEIAKATNFKYYLQEMPKQISTLGEHLVLGADNQDDWKYMAQTFVIDYKTRYEWSQMGLWFHDRKSIRIHSSFLFQNVDFKNKVFDTNSAWLDFISQKLVKDNQWNFNFTTHEVFAAVQKACASVENDFIQNADILQ